MDSSFGAAMEDAVLDLSWPFGTLDGLDHDDIRETAYEVFFTACRSSPGFGGNRNSATFYSNHHHLHDMTEMGSLSGSPGGRAGGGGGGPVVVMTPASKIKRALGLKMLRRSPSRRMSGGGLGSLPGSPGASSNNVGGGSSPSMYATVPPARPRRPLTSAEIMRMQMRVTEQSDNRLRKTLMRTLVGQTGRRSETMILPLELLRHLKPSEFNDMHEYHAWQRRQLKILETGLLLHPAIPSDKSNTHAMRLREIIHSSETKAIDTSKNSETMRTLCNSVVSLSWRSFNGGPSDTCHWADGFPLNVHVYVSLLQSIFDIRDETLVLDEVDELVELMKKTWSTLGISKPVHNLCFTWVLFQQYVATSQTEADLLCAAHAMLAMEVAMDAKKPDREVMYVKMLSAMLASIQNWAERRLLHYHDYFMRGNAVLIENLLPLALSASKILGEDVTITDGDDENGNTKIVDSSMDRVDHYIRSSVKNAFSKTIETGGFRSTDMETRDETSEALLQLAKETEDLALRERESFTPILKKWHPVAGSIAAVTLHQSYGAILKQYLGSISMLTSRTVDVLKRAGKLEKILVQMLVEDSEESDDGGKAIIREMVPYEVDSIILRLARRWIEDKFERGRECLLRARESETWNPKSKDEPHAQSATELVKMADDTVDEFLEIPIAITENLVCEIADGLEHVFQDYTNFTSACGSKQNYIPPLPPLTRCNSSSRFIRLWKKTSSCSLSPEELNQKRIHEAHHHPRPSTSRGTQRLYVRLNTLYYLLSHLHSLDKSLTLAPRTGSSYPRHAINRRHRGNGYSYFERAIASISSGCEHVSEVIAYRLIFLDSSSVFYESLYVHDVANSRIKPALRALKQNLSLLTVVLTDRAQALAIREVMRASFEAYLMVLLAGGWTREFYRSDHPMIQEDFESLKRVFCTCSEGLVNEEVVEREAEVVEGVIELMGRSTEQLMEDFSIAACESSGVGVIGAGLKLPMPSTTGRWKRSDPNTILRVLCHRNDNAANQFLKKTFQLAKRRGGK